MGFLAPAVLLAAVAVAIPLVLHLFHRRDPHRVPFPALRYLRKAARDHARSIRFRQLLLLALRVLAVLLLVAAGARLYVRRGTSSHEATALALILDNSMSSGVVEGDRQALDRLKDLALETLELAGPDDRVWVLRAGEPWDVARPRAPTDARRRVLETEPSGGSGDLVAMLERAAALVLGSELPAAEVHLLSDLQAAAFPGETGPDLPPHLPVVTLLPRTEPPANRWVARVGVAGGLPPVAGEATEIVARIDALGGAADSISVKLVMDGSIRAVAFAPPGSEVILPAGPFAQGMVSGWVEIDPDALRADDRRHVALPIRQPPPVLVAGSRGDDAESPDFLLQALTVLEDGGRIRLVESPDEANLTIARGGDGLTGLPVGMRALVIPPTDPTLLPALNRGLARVGIPWRLEPTGDDEGGETRVARTDIPPELSSLRVYRHYRLQAVGEPGGRAPVVLATDDPWLVMGRGSRGPYLLLASALEPEAVNLPVSASMIPFLDWTLRAWASGAGDRRNLMVGERLPRIPGATAVEGPDGTQQPLAGNGVAPEARIPGAYRMLRGDTVLDLIAVNPPPAESRLTSVEIPRLRALVGAGLVGVPEASGWSREIFVRRKGPELWRPLLVAALMVLVAESLLAAGAPSEGGGSEESRLTETKAGKERAPV